MRIRTRYISEVVSTLVIGLVSTAALADNSAPKLEEVMVVAQKAEQSLRDVPISINALSAEMLTESGTRSFEDLATASAGLFITGSRDGQAQGVTIRGVGSQAFTDVQRPNVGVFIDGVPVRRLDGAFSNLVDVSSVEILKGPQSTLYGKEVSAGAILINTAKPEFEKGARLESSFGSNDLQNYKGMINVPIGDTVAVRANLYYSEADSEIKNILSGDTGSLENKGGRIKLLYIPIDELEMTLGYSQPPRTQS